MAKRLSKDILSYLQPHPDCISLAWMIAKQVTNPKIELDCSIMVTGHKGIGKSIFSIGLCYEVAKCISIIKHKKELKQLNMEDRIKRVQFYINEIFNMDHIRSVDKDGTLQMFTSETIQKENSVLLLDDVSIAAGSRNSMTTNNKMIGAVLTVSRPFRNVIVMNSVYTSLIDKQARGFADITIEMVGIDQKNSRSVCKAYLYSVNQNSGKEYRKFFTYKGMRIKYWISYLPPKYLRDAYKKLRMEKTKELLQIFNTETEKRNNVGTKRIKRSDEIMDKYREQILQMYAEGKSLRAMTRVSPDLSIHYVNKIIATGVGK